MFGLLSLLLAGALIVARQALSRSDDAKEHRRSAGGTAVTLTEFAIDPSTIAVDTGGSLTVKNSGTLAAQPRGQGHDLKTPTSRGRSRTSLDVSILKTGMYTAYCQISGHEAAGMTAMSMSG